MKTLEEIKTEIRERLMAPAKAVEQLDAYIAANPSDDEALTLRGMKHWSLGERALAINDYLEAIRINPDSKARQALQATNDILDYYNKDLYNP